MANTEMREEALGFLVNHDAGVLSTTSSAGQPRARLMYYTCDDSFNIFFLTLANTRKVSDLTSNPRAAFVVSETDIPRTIQIEGTAEDLTDTAPMDPLLTNFINELTAKRRRYGLPIEHFDMSVIKLYKLTPTWVRWGDFTFGQGTDQVLTEIEEIQEGS